MKPSFSFSPLLFAVALIGVLPLNGQAVELSLIRGRMTNLGVDSDARGVATAIFTPHNPKFRLDADGLDAGTYTLTVDGIPEESFVVGASGVVHFDFRTWGGTGAKKALDFDPRGHVLAINNGTADVLSMMFSGEGEPDSIRVDERTSLKRATTETRGRVQLRYLEQKNKDRFIIHMLAMNRGNYEIFVDGQSIAEVPLVHGRSRMLVFESSKNLHGHPHKLTGHKRELDFDPRGLIVDVVRDGAIIFSGEMLAKIPGVNVVEPAEAVTQLTTTGADADATATATATITRDSDGETHLTVKASNLTPGDYTFTVDGVDRGTLTIGADGTGEIEFSTDADDDELLLDFDVLGATVQIKQGATVFCNGTLSTTLTPDPTPTETQTELPLLNQGEIADASGHVTLTTESDVLVNFEVKVSDVPVGTYDVKVGGVLKGTITTVDSNGVVSGKLVFSTTPATGETILDFDPRGQTVTVEQSGTVLLSRPL